MKTTNMTMCCLPLKATKKMQMKEKNTCKTDNYIKMIQVSLTENVTQKGLEYPEFQHRIPAAH